MIKGIGIDLVELERIGNSIRKSDRLQKRVLTANEQEVFDRLPNRRRQTEYLAGRFAAKEAFAKATGRGIGKLSFQDIEVLPGAGPTPELHARGYEHMHVFVSISHSKSNAISQVILEER